MKKRKKRLRNRIIAIVAAILAVCIVGYFAFCYWVNAAGSLIKSKNAGTVDSGSAIVVDGSGRRDGVFTMFVAATDEDETRTDSMMVLVFDTNKHTANVINIPRDTLVDTRRKGAGKKLNASYAKGIDETLDEVSEVIGFRPDKYVVANFDGIADIVDAIGGIDYEIPFDMSYHDPSQDLCIEFEAGMQHLNGEKVVEFLRWRHNDHDSGYENGDLGRVEKLQDFLITLGSNVLKPSNIMNIPEISKAIYKNVDTDLTAAQIVWLGMQGMKVDMDKGVTMQTLIGDTARVDVNPCLWFFICDEEMIIEQINDCFNPYEEALDEDDFNIITPDDLDIYSRSWEEEKACRYASYEKQKNKDNNDSGSGEQPDDDD